MTLRSAAQPPDPTPRDGADRHAGRRSLRRRHAVLAALVALGVVVVPFALDRFLHWSVVLRGVWVSDVALSGLDEAEASVAVEQLADRLAAAPLQVRVDRELFQLSPKQVGFEVDVAGTVHNAKLAGRSSGLGSQLWWWLKRWVSPARLTLQVGLDTKALEKELTRFEAAAIAQTPFEGGVQAGGGKVIPEYPRRGRLIDRVPAATVVLAALTRVRRSVVELPLREVTPLLTRSDVDRATVAARRLLHGPVRLTSADGQHTIRLSAAKLGDTLRTRIVSGPRPELEVFFDPKRLEHQLAALRSRVEAQPQNARFAIDARNRISIAPSEPGVRLRSELVAPALLQAATATARIGLLPLDRSAEPSLKTDEATALGISQLLSSFTTFHPCCRPRVENIHRIADLLTGTVVKPGKTLSVNQVVGPRTRKNGFVPAPTIEEGEMVDSVGGGISQFATTLFNAVFHGGYDIIERQPHSYYFSRYPMGHEATLSYPKPDLVFRNDTDAGLLIVCEYGKTFIRVKLYGDNGGRKVKAKVSRRMHIREPDVELVADPELEPDEEEVLQAGSPGWTVIVARVITFTDGTTKEEKRRVTYSPRVRRVAVHPCRIPEGEEGYTGEACPVPEDEAELPDLDDETDGASEFEAPPDTDQTAPEP
jgi:vancomycin resistance protein YoaR